MIIEHTDAICRLAPSRSHENADLTAPRRSGERLIAPPLEQAGEWAAANRSLIDHAVCDVQGRELRDLAADARTELAAAAWRYTSRYRSAAKPAAEPARVFVAGHQPELFHPGVWLKNFALGRLAEMHGGVAVNLVIDSDTIKSSALRVPGGSVAEPTVEAVAFDRPSPEIPFQARAIQDPALFASFGSRAAARLAPLVPSPLVRRILASGS